MTTTTYESRSASKAGGQAPVVMLLGSILLTSCAAAPFLIPVAFEFARNLFQTSLQNYGSKHRDNVSVLVNRLASPYMQGLAPPQIGSPGMPTQGFPVQPGVQGQPCMPGQPDPSQQQFSGQSGTYSSNPSSPGQFDPSQQQFPGQPGMVSPNPCMQTQGGLPPQFGVQGQPSFGQGTYNPNPYSGAPGYQGQPGMPMQQPGMPIQQPAMPMQQYPGQQTFAGQGGYDPNNPYGIGQQQMHPYGTPSPYGNQVNPYGAQNPYGGSGFPSQPGYGNVYGSPNPYGAQNPYATPGLPPQPGQPNPYGSSGYGGAAPFPGQPGYDPNNPYGSGGTGQNFGTQPGYGQPQPGQPNLYGSAYGGVAPFPGQPGDPNNPYGSGAMGQSYGQPQPGYGQPQPGYGTSSPYGTQPPQAYGQAYGGYGGGGIYPRSITEPVTIDVAMVRQKQTEKVKEVVLMNDGEILRDGGANKDSGDKFKIVLRTNCDCYVYVVSIDGSAWTQPVFPSKGSKISNPVKKEEEFAFPEGEYWFTLDQVKGIETFFVVASQQRRPDLEESFAQMAAETRPAATIVAKVEEPPIIPGGVGSVTPRGVIAVKLQEGDSADITPLSYSAKEPGQDVTVTRWFKHE